MVFKRLVTVLFLGICLGCGGGGDDENTSSGSEPVEDQDSSVADATQDIEEEDDGLCSSGDVKCEGKKVFKCVELA